jgi:hypothetical protein
MDIITTISSITDFNNLGLPTSLDLSMILMATILPSFFGLAQNTEAKFPLPRKPCMS